MESPILSAKVEWEARRVAAAFLVETYKSREEDWLMTFVGHSGTTQIWWNIDTRTNAFFYIEVGDGGCEVNLVTMWPEGTEEWRFHPSPEFHAQMARGLYCLGFEDEAVLTTLNHPLTAHEQLELRLSMPREFWPQIWLNELQT